MAKSADSSKRRVLSIALAVVGLATFLAIARFILGADLGRVVEVLKNIAVLPFAIAILVRLSTPLLHVMGMYFATLCIGRALRFRDMFVGITAALAMEYVAPVGGVTEVYKVFYLTRRGLTLNEASLSVFLHRVALSLSIATVFGIACIVSYVPSYVATILWIAIAALAFGNVVGLTFFCYRKTSSFVSRIASWIVAKMKIEAVLNPMNLSRFEKPRFRSKYLLLLAASTLLERFTVAFSGYMLARSLGISIDILEAVVLFDAINTVVWLLPAMTPGFVGMLETVQSIAFTAYGIEPSLATSLAILNRIAILVAVVPQLLPFLAKDVREVLEAISRERSVLLEGSETVNR